MALFRAAHEKATFSRLAESGNLNGSRVAGQPAPPAFPPSQRLEGSQAHRQLQTPREIDSLRACAPSPRFSHGAGISDNWNLNPGAPGHPSPLHTGVCGSSVMGGGSEEDGGEQCIQCELS